MSRIRLDDKRPVPAPGGDATHPPVIDNPGEAPQVQMIADAKAIQDAELEVNEQNSLDAEAKDLKKTVKGAAPITVVALRAGFFKGSRKQEGDKFVIASEEEFGDWMKKI